VKTPGRPKSGMSDAQGRLGMVTLSFGVRFAGCFRPLEVMVRGRQHYPCHPFRFQIFEGNSESTGKIDHRSRDRYIAVIRMHIPIIYNLVQEIGCYSVSVLPNAKVNIFDLVFEYRASV
jgi:hypothetical protein